MGTWGVSHHEHLQEVTPKTMSSPDSTYPCKDSAGEAEVLYIRGAPDGTGVTPFLYPPRIEVLDRVRELPIIVETDGALGEEYKGPLGVIQK